MVRRQERCSVLVFALGVIVHVMLRNSNGWRTQFFIVALVIVRRLEAVSVVAHVECRLRHQLMLVVARRPWMVQSVLRTTQRLVCAVALWPMQVTRRDIVKCLQHLGVVLHVQVLSQLRLVMLVVVRRGLASSIHVLYGHRVRYGLRIRPRLERLLYSRIIRQLEVDILVLDHFEELDGLRLGHILHGSVQLVDQLLCLRLVEDAILWLTEATLRLVAVAEQQVGLLGNTISSRRLHLFSIFGLLRVQIERRRRCLRWKVASRRLKASGSLCLRLLVQQGLTLLMEHHVLVVDLLLLHQRQMLEGLMLSDAACRRL